jgi:hypothetical protein
MFAGALMNTKCSPAAGTGFVSPSFTVTGTAYLAANYASYHKFKYAAAYA